MARPLREMFVEFFAEFDLKGYKEANEKVDKLGDNFRALSVEAGKASGQFGNTARETNKVGNSMLTTAANTAILSNNAGALRSKLIETGNTAANTANRSDMMKKAFALAAAASIGFVAAIAGVVFILKQYVDLIVGTIQRTLEFASAMSELGLNIRNVSNRLGISARQLQAWNQALAESGLDTEALGDALTDLSEKIGEALRDRSSGSASLFRKLGISLRDAEGNARGVNDVFLDLADSMQGIDSDAERIFVATQLMSDSGRRLVPVLSRGSGALREYEQQLAETQPGFSEFIENSEELGREQAKLNQAWEGAKQQLFNALAPALVEIVRQVREFIVEIQKSVDLQEVFKAGLLALGVAFAVLSAIMLVFVGILATVAFILSPIIAIFVILGAIIGYAVLAIQDFYVFLRGGDSVTERFIKSLLGIPDAIGRMIQSLVAANSPIGRFLNMISAAANTVVGLYNAIARVGGLPEVAPIDLRLGLANALPSPRSAAQARIEDQQVIEGLRNRGQQTFNGRLGIQTGTFGPNAALGVASVAPPMQQRSFSIVQNNNQRIEVNEATDARETRRLIQEEIQTQNRDLIEVLGTSEEQE